MMRDMQQITVHVPCGTKQHTGRSAFQNPLYRPSQDHTIGIRQYAGSVSLGAGLFIHGIIIGIAPCRARARPIAFCAWHGHPKSGPIHPNADECQMRFSQ